MSAQLRSSKGGGLGSGGYCVCPKCGERIPHQCGVPCQNERCPVCSTKMLREGSPHHALWKKKQNRKDEGS